MNKISVVIMNLGGPDKTENVKSFLFNLFNDPLILRVPKFLRFIIAWFISRKREQTAIAIYKQIGGKSPLLENTIAQKKQLFKSLQDEYPDTQFQIEIIMRYWHPFCKDVMKKIEAFNPDKIILLPLYPQFSTTTTMSSVREFESYFKGSSSQAKLQVACCYPFEESFIKAYADLVNNYIKQALSKYSKQDIKIIFSAHGLPEKIIKNGDPYQWQVEESTKLIVSRLEEKDIETINSYQSRVGPVSWIKPFTDEEIKKAGKAKKAIILVPISFVSEHSETLVELDIEYKDLAVEFGVLDYYRVPTLGVNEHFINSLKDITKSLIDNPAIKFYPFKRICDKEFCGCINSN
ncbi:ferrochelatase [Rickettsiales endosymbiont of Stachyamoeba lipophora]|uniref:ferrochelatase n=1 Tax=Rickettsiales endosymbiont of Stachyamoeba lipophora TaxID=2486578 RepID=UPI000F654216|nr:ferrochelatase [Rickettsiales endosymbiont of Stachyamoeba lipophora]AZL15606.1 ferrochelatase [Rickettsiales endosymbiont of Stachyamoeba lipophora]